MELTPQQYKDIQSYLSEEMTAEERLLFEELLQQDENLKAHLEFEQELSQQIAGLVNEEDKIGKLIADAEQNTTLVEGERLRKQIQEVGDAWLQQKKISVASGESTEKKTGESGVQIVQMPKRRTYSWLAAAACAAVVLGVWFFWPKPQPGGTDPLVVKNDTPKTKPPDSGLAHINPIDTASKKNYPPIITPSVPPTRLFAENFEPDAVPMEKPEYLLAQLDEYDAGNMQPILDADLKNIPKIRGSRGADEQAATRATGRYYQGLAYLQLDSSSKAITAFTEVRKNAPADSLRRKATWYLAMAYLKKGKGKEAKPLLQQLAADKRAGMYYKKSMEIIKKME